MDRQAHVGSMGVCGHSAGPIFPWTLVLVGNPCTDRMFVVPMDGSTGQRGPAFEFSTGDKVDFAYAHQRATDYAAAQLAKSEDEHADHSGSDLPARYWDELETSLATPGYRVTVTNQFDNAIFVPFHRAMSWLVEPKIRHEAHRLEADPPLLPVALRPAA